MSYLENTAASASVVADENITVQILNAAHINSLLSSDHVFSSRFFYSLAITLSERPCDIQAKLK